MIKTFLPLIASCAALAAEWSKPVEVRQEEKVCLSYRAKLEGEWLMVEADIQPGWHTFAMDNKQRADEKLAGKMSLGLDRPTSVLLKEGLEINSGWSQTPPKDFSKPEIRWYAWGFEEKAVFAAKVKRAGTGAALVGIKGQACTETTCKNIDVEIAVPPAGEASAASSPKGLIPVREK
ncbi:MAG: hypothetical protein U0Q16_13815 [Bryobacteraceae bacterium]